MKKDSYISSIRQKIMNDMTFSSSFYGTGMLKEDHGTCKFFHIFKLENFKNIILLRNF